MQAMAMCTLTKLADSDYRYGESDAVLLARSDGGVSVS